MTTLKKILPTTDEKMDVVFVGHVDHGKSTVIGRMLADTGSLPDGKLEQIRLDCERNSKPFEYAYLIDALKDERAQSITIDSARVFFQSQQRRYIIIDAPGHIEFIKNMITGASRAEAAILVIDAQEGVQENSRRHGYLLWMLGIRQIVVVVNKMDLVNYDQATFEAVRDEYSAFLGEIGVEPLCYIPVSGREGNNVATLSKDTPENNTPWYDGHTVLSALDSFQKAAQPHDKPFRLPVQDVYKFTMFGDDRRIIAGTIASGTAQTGDDVVFYPSGKRSAIQQFEMYAGDNPPQATSGQATGFTMTEQIYVKRGDIVCKPDQPKPFISRKLRGSLFWLGKQPMTAKKQYTLKLGTNRVRAQIETIHRVIDASALANSDKTIIEHHDVAEVTFALQHAIAFDMPDICPDTGRFVLVDNYEIWGGGIVLGAVDDESAALRDEVHLREAKWIRSNVNMQQRATRYNQKPAIVLITGQRHAGRKRLAAALERQLFVEGKHVYYLGVGSVMYGINADLKRADAGDHWQEHLRRIAQLAHIMLDAGMLLIMTAVELTQDDLKTISTIVGPDRVETVWLGEEVTTDLRYDLHIEDAEDIESATVQIKGTLGEHGVIFVP